VLWLTGCTVMRDRAVIVFLLILAFEIGVSIGLLQWLGTP
jgi:hypothetical protein